MAEGHPTTCRHCAPLVLQARLPLTLCAPSVPHAGAGLEAEALEQQLRRTLYLASRSADRRVVGTAWAAYTFLQRAAAGSPDAACRTKVGPRSSGGAEDLGGGPLRMEPRAGR